jgi:hypothetical protein
LSVLELRGGSAAFLQATFSMVLASLLFVNIEGDIEQDLLTIGTFDDVTGIG